MESCHASPKEQRIDSSIRVSVFIDVLTPHPMLCAGLGSYPLFKMCLKKYSNQCAFRAKRAWNNATVEKEEPY